MATDEHQCVDSYEDSASKARHSTEMKERTGEQDALPNAISTTISKWTTTPGAVRSATDGKASTVECLRQTTKVDDGNGRPVNRHHSGRRVNGRPIDPWSDVQSTSPEVLGQAPTRVDGVDHLRKLLIVLERMEELREENHLLQHRCAFLEDTKMLLRQQNCILMLEHTSGKMVYRKSKSLQSDIGGDVIHLQVVKSLPGQRRSSADDRRQGAAAVRMHDQRSLSVSSIGDLVEMEIDAADQGTGGGGGGGGGRTPAASAQPSDERRSIQKTWKQVKNAFSGKVETGSVSAELLLRSNSRKAEGWKRREDRFHSFSASPSSVQQHQQQQSSNVKNNKKMDKQIPSIVLSTKTTDEAESLPSMAVNCSEEIDAVEEEEGEKEERFRPKVDDEQSSTVPPNPWLQQTPLRRRSSPLPSASDGLQATQGRSTGREALLAVDSGDGGGGGGIARSSSFRSPKAAPEVEKEGSCSKSLPTTPVEPSQTAAAAAAAATGGGRKTNKGPWGKVMDILQPRKGSLKNGRGGGGGDDDVSEDSKDETLLPQSNAVSESSSTNTPSFAMRSPSRKASAVSSSSKAIERPGSTRGQRYSLSSSTVTSPVSPMNLASLFGVNDEFTKKMEEWEEKKKKKGVTKRSGISSTKFSEDFIRKMEEWEEKRGHQQGGGGKPGSKGRPSPSRVSPEGAGSATVPPSQENEEAQLFLSKSFSRTVQDWEEARRRRRRGAETKDKNDDRSVSTERDKKTEKELRKIEKKEQKLEHELAKLAQLRLKLDSQETVKAEDWGGRQRRRSGPVTPSPSRAQRRRKTSDRMTQAAAADSGGRPWDTLSTAQQSPQIETGGEEGAGGGEGEGGGGGGGGGRSISVSQTSLDSLSSVDSQTGQGGEEEDVDSQRHRLCQRTLSSPGSGLKDRDRQDESTFGVSKAEKQLKNRDRELSALREKVQILENQIKNMKKIYNESIEQFQKELWSSPGRCYGSQTVESKELTETLTQLSNRLDLLQRHGERITKEISHTQMKLSKEATRRRLAEERLVADLRQMQWTLDERHLPEVVVLLCSYVTRLQSKGIALGQCLAERVLLIQELERHLLVQEVINKLLQADIERNAIGLNHMKEFQRLAIVRRWKTFNGNDFLVRDEQLVQQENTQQQQQQQQLKIPQSCKRVQTLLAQVGLDPEPFDVDADWLESIRNEAEQVLNRNSRALQTDRLQSHRVTDIGVQTTVTPYDPSFSLALSTPFQPLHITSTCESTQQLRHHHHQQQQQQQQQNSRVMTDESFGGMAVSVDGWNGGRLLVPEKFSFGQDTPRKSSAPESLTEAESVWFQRSAVAKSAPPSSSSPSSSSFAAQETTRRSPPPPPPPPPPPASASTQKRRTLNEWGEKWGMNSGDSAMKTTTVDSTKTRKDEIRERSKIDDDKRRPDRSNSSFDEHATPPPPPPPQSASKDTETEKTTAAAAAAAAANDSCSRESDALADDDDDDAGEMLTCDNLYIESSNVFSSSEEGLQWERKCPPLVKETPIDEFFCHLPLTPLASSEQQQQQQQQQQHAPTVLLPFKKSAMSPIVVRKLKSATELMHIYRRTQPASTGDHRETMTTATQTSDGPPHHQETAIDDAGVVPTKGLLPPALLRMDGEEEERERLSRSTSTDEERQWTLIGRQLPSDPASPLALCPSSSSSCSSSSSSNRFQKHFKPISPPPPPPPPPPPAAEKSFFAEKKGSSSAVGDRREIRTSQSDTDCYRSSYTSSNISIPIGTSNRTSPLPASSVDSSRPHLSQDLRLAAAAAAAAARSGGGRSCSSGRSAKSVCRALCLHAMSVELTDESADGNNSHTSSQKRELDQDSSKGKAKWLEKPKKLFKSLK